MKTKIIVLAALCLLIIIAGIFLYNNYQNLPINGTLNINGKDITNENRYGILILYIQLYIFRKK